jgi:hypothetical protein
VPAPFFGYSIIEYSVSNATIDVEQ